MGCGWGGKGGGGYEGGEGGEEEMGEFAEGAGWPGVDLEVRWEGGGVGEVVESGVGGGMVSLGYRIGGEREGGGGERGRGERYLWKPLVL